MWSRQSRFDCSTVRDFKEATTDVDQRIQVPWIVAL